MDTWQYLLDGLQTALQPGVLIFLLVGVVVGYFVGVLPGLGPVPTIALLLPLTFTLDPTAAIVMLAGVYYGAMYGGAVPSVLLHMPGESATVVTMFDGYPMTKQGRGATALGTAALASFLGGTISVIGLTLLAPQLAEVALSFGAAEYTALLVAGLMLVSSLTGSSPLRGLISATLGLMIGTVGIDLNSGQARYTGGIFQLYEGIDFAIAAIGLFAISEILFAVSERHSGAGQKPYKRLREMVPTRQDIGYSAVPAVRGGLLGFITGVLPGAGATLASFLAYGVERKVSKRRHLFGKGAIEGVATPEAATNAATGGSMAPMLTLGIPGSAVTALLLSALITQGIEPGPQIFAQQPGVVWGLIGSLYIGNFVLLLLAFPFVSLSIQLLRMPGSLLYTLIAVLSLVGAYSINYQLFAVWLMLGFGVVGYVLRRLDFPLAPMILALVLGPLLESNFRRALTISQGDPLVFVQSGISIGLLVTALLLLLLPVLLAKFGKPSFAGAVASSSEGTDQASGPGAPEVVEAGQPASDDESKSSGKEG